MSVCNRWRGGLAGLFLSLAPALSVQAQDVAPLEAYGVLPAYEMVGVSPSGDRMAYIMTTGEDRSLIINDLTDMSLIGGVRAGDVKVRGIGWIGEDHVFIYSTATQVAASIGIRRAELADASIYSIPTRNVALALSRMDGPNGALARTEGTLGKVMGSPIVRTLDGEPGMIVPGSGRPRPRPLPDRSGDRLRP